ncbi:MAG: hypothetical protein RLY70_4034, partial [Planctomycetota bacterium]
SANRCQALIVFGAEDVHPQEGNECQALIVWVALLSLPGLRLCRNLPELRIPLKISSYPLESNRPIGARH